MGSSCWEEEGAGCWRRAMPRVLSRLCHNWQRRFHCPLCQHSSPALSRVGQGWLWQGGSCVSQLVHLGAVLLSLPFFLIPGCSPHPHLTPCEDGRGKLGEALPTKLGCPENPQHVRLYAEHLIYCFICFHEDPHSTQEEVGAQRG